MNKSIGNRIINSFLIIIVLTVSIIDTLLITGYRQYYYSAIESNMRYRLDNAVDVYQKNYSLYPLEDLAKEQIDLIPRSDHFQVQIIN